MGRPTTYNRDNGRDHWSVGAVMFLVHGITGNRVGAAAAEKKPYLIPVSPETLATDAEQAGAFVPST